jgi:hypothetical protein
MRAAKPNPLERERVRAILEFLQAKYPQWLWVRVEPASALRARAYRGTGYAKKMPEDAWSDGVADVLGMRKGHDSIAFEVKRTGGKQRPSQIEFESRFNAKAGRYYVVHDPDEVERAMKGIG